MRGVGGWGGERLNLCVFSGGFEKSVRSSRRA